jgi:YD repeat-containing protein
MKNFTDSNFIDVNLQPTGNNFFPLPIIANSMRHVYLFLVLLCLASTSAHGQADVPVDLLTGKAQVVLPIGSLTQGGLSVPIAVAYNGGGYKVSDGEGTAGAGWNLAAGGSVSRELKGLPDEYDATGDSRKGWLYSSLRIPLSSFVPTSNTGCNDWANFNQFTALADTEPDIFNVNAPGLRAKFVLDNTGTFRTMPYQDIKIVYATTFAGGVRTIYSFEITDSKGFKYIFNQVTELVVNPWGATSFNQFAREYSLLNGTKTFNSSWQLTSIIGPYGESASFYYGGEEVTQNQQRVRAFNLTTGIVEDKYALNVTTTRTPLTTIIVGGMSADLTWSSYGGVISSVRITNDNDSKVFNFDYSVVEGTAEAGQTNGIAGIRNYLSKITQASSCDTYPSYSFEYYSPEALPYKNKYPVDIFGYFNSQYGLDENASFRPPIYQNDAAADGERFRIYNKAGYTGISTTGSRGVNPSTVHYGSLKKINYPSGGFAEITWQPNEYFDEGVSANAYGAGVRVASVKISDGDADASNDIIRNYEYKKSDGTSSGRWLYMPSFAFADGTGIYASTDNLAPDQTMNYERATIIFPGSGKTVYEYLVPGRYPQTSISDWNATRTRVVSSTSGGCPSQGNLQSGYFIYPFADNTNYDFEQGLLSKVQQYNEGGIIVQEQNYTYQRLNPGMITVKAMKLEKANRSAETWNYGLYSLMLNVGKTVQTESVTNYDLSTPSSQTVSKNYVYNSNQLLSEMNTITSDGSTLKTEYKYAKDLNPNNPSGTYATMLMKLNAMNMTSTLIEAVSYRNATVTGASLSLYDDMGTSYPYLKQTLSYKGNGSIQKASLSGSPQQFIFDNSNYFTVTTFEEYGTAGIPLTTTGSGRIPASMLFTPSMSSPVALFANARGKESVFSDFESNQLFQIALSNSTDAWSGVKSYQLTANTPVSKSGVLKSGVGQRYRFRCRAKATTASDITVTINLSNASGGWTTAQIGYSASASGQWQLLEGYIPTSAVASSFTFQLLANANLLIDDVVLAPEQAAVQSFTYQALTGKTSETDARGYSTFYEYDALGKLAYEKNTDKHIVRAHEYRYKIQAIPQPKSSFACTGCGVLYVGNSVTFTAGTNCISPLTYEWKVNGVVAGTGSVLNYTFASAQENSVQLTVSHSIYGVSSTAETFLVNPQPLGASITGDGSDIICNAGNTTRQLTLATSGCYSTQNLTCNWYFKKDFGNWILIQSTPTISNLTYDCFAQGVVNSGVYFKAEIVGRCVSGTFSSAVYTESNVFQVMLAPNYHPCAN